VMVVALWFRAPLEELAAQAPECENPARE